MSRLDELKEQIAANAAADKANLDTIADAVVELGSDISRIDQKIADLQTKVVDDAELAEQVQALKDESAASTERAAALAQAIRSAVPTEAPETTEDTPPAPVEETPVSDAPPAGGAETEG